MNTTVHPIKDKKLIQRFNIPPSLREKMLKVSEGILDDLMTPTKEKIQVMNTIVKMDTLNVREKEILVKSQPKLVLHAKMSDEQLVNRVNELMTELGLVPEDAGLLLEAQQSFLDSQQEQTNDASNT